MKKLLIALFLQAFFLTSFAQIIRKEWYNSVNVEFSTGITGYASDYGYKSAGIAASYGLLLNEHYFVGLGIKPNYIFSDGDYDGFFLPIYGEFKYESLLNERNLGGFGVARVGYSVIDKRGVYAHAGGGLKYKKWEFGLGVSYQHATFKEQSVLGDTYDTNYNLVFGTISVGYHF